MKFNFTIGKSKLGVNVNKVGIIMRGIGLTFKTKNTENLLFTFRKPSRVAITSIFVFFPFMAVWLDENKKVIEYKIVKPFTLSLTPKFDSKYLIELPLNSKNKQIINKILDNKI